MPKTLKKLISPLNIFIFLILTLALFVRVYRIEALLGFYYDQGRDALVIWDFWKNGKLFLIGPTTGIEGVFRGPWYYWLITPFYILGKGNPVWPSVFLSLTTVVGVFLAYKLAEKLGGKLAGFIALFVGSFSLNLVFASRWLSNPTPMLLISMIFVYSLFLVLDSKKWAWILASLMAGMAMQFGSAAEVFYFLALAAFAVYLFFKDKKKLPGVKTIAISLFFLGLTFAPQILFDLRHEGILRGTISKFLFQEGSFKLTFWEIAKIRFPFYYDVFFSKLFQSMANAKAIFAIIFGLLLFYKRKVIIKDKRFVLV